MTAPLTPPHRPSSSSSSGDGDPWRAPAGGTVPHGEPWGAQEDAAEAEAKARELRRDLRDAAVVLAGVTVLGVVLGLLWLWLAPRVPLVSDGEAVFLRNTESEEAVGADGMFALLAAGLGVLSAAAVFLFRRRGGIALVLALALGGLLASLLGWGVGVWLGPGTDVAERARQVGEGVTFDAYLQLRAKGALLAWPLAAMVAHLGLTALFGPDDPEPVRDEQHQWPPRGA
ncbi:ABC transporter permease [Streptomyces sp. C10-9-1]|uniref:ABC transporter permease n=1 Tax=Streptomyces sp. C10-9-1 TaxID=1859285 RepID=UPI002111CD2C|nr:ABC transporter permease [Streptomyces sp. C10-9-1]MCQ6556079.1 ABC transporter permease [Streptomyces sp. C10-9-1]